jgi:antitoxin component YwqK of YwqJK toxin-antitoxin module
VSETSTKGEAMRKISSLVLAILIFVSPALSPADTWEGKTNYDGQKDGAWLRSSDDSVLLEMITYRNDVPHGPSAGFYASSRKQYETNFKDGEHHGAYISYHDNEENSPAAKGSHANGQKTGEWTEWYPNQQEQSIISYFNGNPQGAAKYFYPSGALQYETVYNNGLHHGPYSSSYDNGDNSQQAAGTHTNNQKSGEWTEWHSNGEIGSVVNYFAGQRNGPAMYFFGDGRISSKTNFKLEQHHGPYVEYYGNFERSLHYKGAHRDNLRFGLWQELAEDGRLISEINYTDGIKNGPATFYRSWDSTIEYTTVFKNDLHHGPYVSYHSPSLVSDYTFLDHLFGDDRPEGQWERVNEFVGEGNERSLKTEWQVLDPETSEVLHVFELEKSADHGPVNEMGEHRNGKRVGEWTRSGDDGRLNEVTNWVDGEKHGLETGYSYYYGFYGLDFINGENRVSSTKNYQNGRLHGLAEHFFNDGGHSIRRRGQYADGHEIGEWAEWYDNGNIKWQGSYDDTGAQTGEWKEFNEDGELLKVTKYENGEVVNVQGE